MIRKILARFVIVAISMLVVACNRRASLTAPSQGSTLTVTLTSKIGNSSIPLNLTGARVEVSLAGPSQQESKMADNNGTAVFSGLELGNYTIKAAGFGFEDAPSKDVSLTEPKQEVSIDMKRVNAIRINVISPQCGTMTLPYGDNTISLDIEYSLTTYYPDFVILWAFLSTDGIDVASAGKKGLFLNSSPQGVTGHFSTGLGVQAVSRERIKTTKYIVSYLVVVQGTQSQYVEVQTLTTLVMPCLFGYQ